MQSTLKEVSFNEYNGSGSPSTQVHGIPTDNQAHSIHFNHQCPN